MRPFLIGLLLLLGLNASLQAQELKANVRINTQTLRTVDPRIFETLQQSMLEFMNNTKWTDDVFENNERIECSVILSIQEELSDTRFRATLAIQSSRPVYNSSYQSVLLNHLDKDIIFDYEQFQPLQFSRNTYVDNISAILSFYAYVILGLDYDSYSLYGGEEYLRNAQEIVNNVPQGAANTYKGWLPGESNQNRYWIIENLLSPRVRPFREALYNYHRYGLDVMADQREEGRAVMAQALDDVQKVFQVYPNAVILQLFANAKSSEIVEVFKRGTRQEQDQVVRIMSRIDAPNADQYQTIK